MKSSVRPIAIYLPQFHPIPENNAWWGKGFTEWTNVTKAKPLFKGHYQPHLPSDLGFYDLRNTEVFYEQIELAKEAGIYGFMFYHYWFNGKRLLETPLENYLGEKKLDFPFCLCWANENWTRRWDGEEEHVLMKQEYNTEDFEKHFDLLTNFFRDERYIRIEGKPVIAIYKTNLIPDPEKFAEVWREKALKSGFPGVYLIRIEATDRKTVPGSINFDASIDFQPDWTHLKKNIYPITFFQKYIDPFLKFVKPSVFRHYLAEKFKPRNTIVDYQKYVDHYQWDDNGYKRYPCIMPSWDNSPRRLNGNAIIFHNSSPGAYGRWLKKILHSFKPYSPEENFVFINAWNEWAEGNHLEPDSKWEKEYLEETKRIFNSTINAHVNAK